MHQVRQVRRPLKTTRYNLSLKIRPHSPTYSLMLHKVGTIHESGLGFRRTVRRRHLGMRGLLVYFQAPSVPDARLRSSCQCLIMLSVRKRFCDSLQNSLQSEKRRRLAVRTSRQCLQHCVGVNQQAHIGAPTISLFPSQARCCA